jgi:hypothetical protein
VGCGKSSPFGRAIEKFDGVRGRERVVHPEFLGTTDLLVRRGTREKKEFAFHSTECFPNGQP